MKTTEIVHTNNSQCVRLPKALEFPRDVKGIVVRRVGRSLVITPANAVWDHFFDLPGIDIGERAQQEQDRR